MQKLLFALPEQTQREIIPKLFLHFNSVQHQCNGTILPQKCLSAKLLTRKEIFIYV